MSEDANSGLWAAEGLCCWLLAAEMGAQVQGFQFLTWRGSFLLCVVFASPAAVVRVRPAFAGEGRYFVRVPEGTNRGRFAFDAGNFSDKLTPGETCMLACLRTKELSPLNQGTCLLHMLACIWGCACHSCCLHLA